MFRRSKGLGYLSLAIVIFFTVSGGPFGLESLLYNAGNAALLLLIATPLCWDVPAILMVLEMNSMMPVNGGYYQWVKRALGLRWAFYEGWWTWLYTFVDLAIYPVLFVEYLSYIFPFYTAYKLPLCLIFIWSGALLNIAGIKPLGKTTLVLGVAVVVPFLLLFVAGLHQHHNALPHPLPNAKFSSIGLALYTVMWNFIGWDNATTYATEVNRPARSYVIAIALAFTGTLAIYCIAVFTALHSGMDMERLNESGFPALGEWIAGPRMGTIIAIGGMASVFGTYLAVLLSVSRVPKEMADDKLLPAFLDKQHPEYKTPYISICIFSGVASILCMFTFSDLLIVDVTLYSAGLLLEFISLIVLRYKQPHDLRPFKIPLKIPGLLVLFSFPVLVLGIAMTALMLSPGAGMSLWLTIAALLSAEAGWRVVLFFQHKKMRLN